jgi:hypothetical protein
VADDGLRGTRTRRRTTPHYLAHTALGGAMPALPPDRRGTLPPPLPGMPPLLGMPPLPRRSRLPAGPRPLPDAAAVRLCLIPESAPPYDAVVTAVRPPGALPQPGSGPAAGGGAPRSSRPGGQGSPDQQKPPAPPGSPAISPGVPSSPAMSSGAPGSPPVPSGTAGAPTMSPDWPARFAQALAETLAGSRSPRQLAPWTTERARERIQRLGVQLSAGQQPRVHRVVTFQPSADAMEMAVVVGFGKRIHALAVRLERAGYGQPVSGRADKSGKWLCTTVEAA